MIIIVHHALYYKIGTHGNNKYFPNNSCRFSDFYPNNLYNKPNTGITRRLPRRLVEIKVIFTFNKAAYESVNRVNSVIRVICQTKLSLSIFDAHNARFLGLDGRTHPRKIVDRPEKIYFPKNRTLRMKSPKAFVRCSVVSVWRTDLNRFHSRNSISRNVR